MPAAAEDQLRHAWPSWRLLPPAQRSRLRACAVYLGVLALLFSAPLAALAVYAARSDLHSHILLVPFIAAYLLYLRRGALPASLATSFRGAALSAGVGTAALAARIAWRGALSLNDALALMAFAFVSFAVAGAFLFLGSRVLAAALFPVAFLLFLVPLPDAAVTWLENASVLASAEAAAGFFTVAGTPMVRHDTVFELPGIVLRVAQECSGIHSSWVLFMCSLLASHLFLRTGWRRFALVAFAVPLGILRNGFRILVVGLLCVHIGPHMIDSPIHRRGGPLFFGLSLVPLFLALAWLRSRENRRRAPAGRT